MEEAPTTENKQSKSLGLAVGIGGLGILLLVLGWYLPVFNGELHPAVVSKASERDDSARESIAQFGNKLLDNKSRPFNPEAARIVQMASAAVGQGDDSKKLAKSLEKYTPLEGPAMKIWLSSRKREGVRNKNKNRIEEVDLEPAVKKRNDEVQIILATPENMPILEDLDPAIVLTAWFHQHALVCESLADELVQKTDSENFAGLRRCYQAVGTLGDLMKNHQLGELMKVIPDIDTLERLSHIAMIQAMLPPFHSFGDHNDKIQIGELSEQVDESLRDHFDEFDTNGDDAIDMREWLSKGFMPLEGCSFPLTYTAVIWAANKPFGENSTGADPRAARQVVDYLMKFGFRGDGYIKKAMSEGRGGLDFVINRTEPISERNSDGLNSFATLSLRSQATATVIRYMLIVFGVLLLVRCWNLLAPVSYTNPRTGPYHRWSRQAVAMSVMLVLLMFSEPAVFSSAHASEYDIAVKVPVAEEDKPNLDDNNNNQPTNSLNMIAAWENSDIIKNVAMTLIFLAIQVAVYFLCLRKIREIDEDPDASPRLKLTLLENEDNLFDMGLYIGIAGTALGLALIMVDFFDKPVAAYASNVFGILCVAVVKIWHVRGVKQKLLIQCRDSEGTTSQA